MTEEIIISKMNKMPESLKKEALNYIEYLLRRYQENQDKRKPKFGSAKGMYKMASDFDAPLDDFKDYM